VITPHIKNKKCHLAEAAVPEKGRRLLYVSTYFEWEIYHATIKAVRKRKWYDYIAKYP